MNAELAEELLNELGSSLESLETQHAALLQLLKDKGIVTDDGLGPYLTQAGKASNVRWRAARIRLESLLSAAKQKEEELAEKERQQAREAQPPVARQEEAATSKNDKGSPATAAQTAGND